MARKYGWRSLGPRDYNWRDELETKGVDWCVRTTVRRIDYLHARRTDAQDRLKFFRDRSRFWLCRWAATREEKYLRYLDERLLDASKQLKDAKQLRRTVINSLLPSRKINAK